MNVPRVDFAQLPPAVRQAVATRTGPVHSARTALGGRNSAVASVLVAERGRVFVKGIPTAHPQTAPLRREVAIAPFLPASAPRLLWHVEAGGWLLVGYQAVKGRHADFQAAEDLHLVRAAIEGVQCLQAPALVELKTAEGRWGPYADEGDAELFAGDVLLHTEWAPDNVLLEGGRVHVLDWAWPTRGAGWIDPYLWALRLMEAGHSAASAVRWACDVESWRDAAPAALRAFGAAVARWWHAIATEDSAQWKVHMAVQAAELRAYLTLEAGAVEC